MFVTLGSHKKPASYRNKNKKIVAMQTFCARLDVKGKQLTLLVSLCYSTTLSNEIFVINI